MTSKGPKAKAFPIPEPLHMRTERAITPNRMRKYRTLAAASLVAYRAARTVAVAAYRTALTEKTDRAWNDSETALDKALLARRDARNAARLLHLPVKLGVKWSARGLRAVQAANRRGS